VGLPGLILELHEGDKKLIFYVSKIEIDPKKKIKIYKPNGILITEKEYSKITEGTFNKYINSMK